MLLLSVALFHIFHCLLLVMLPQETDGDAPLRHRLRRQRRTGGCVIAESSLQAVHRVRGTGAGWTGQLRRYLLW